MVIPFFPEKTALFCGRLTGIPERLFRFRRFSDTIVLPGGLFST